MATNTWVPLRIVEGVALADLTGIQIDLKRAIQFAERLQKAFADEAYDLVEVMSISALVAYARSFKSGVRRRLNREALRVLTDDQRSVHDYLIDIRDKHVAHSVNAFEESIPTARYWVERVKDEGITSIGCLHTRIASLSWDDAAHLIEIATVLEAHVGEAIDSEQKRLLAFVRSLPLATVLAEEHGEPLAANPDTARRPRQRMANRSDREKR